MRLVVLTQRFLVVGMIASVLASSAFAQPPGGGGGRGGRGGGGMMGFGGRGGGGLMSLLRMEEVKKELKIDDAASKSLESLGEKLQEARTKAFEGMGGGGGGGGFRNFQDMSETERADMMKKMEEGQKKLAAATKELEKELDSILDPDQMDRLLGLLIQRDSFRAITSNDKVAEALKVTADQKEKLAAVEKAAADEMRTAFAPPGGAGGGPGAGGFDFEAMRKKMEEMGAKTNEKAMAVLTDDQKKEMEKMKGAKFEFPQMGFGGPGGGGGGGRGGRPGGGRPGN